MGRIKELNKRVDKLQWKVDRILLLGEMKRLIENGYKYNGHFPYELYTLMCGAVDRIEFGEEYSMDLHCELMDKVEKYL